MKTTTNSWGITEIYLESEEVKNIQKTVSDMLDRLATEAKKHGEAADKYTQLVIQLNEDAHTDKEWKIFAMDKSAPKSM